MKVDVGVSENVTNFSNIRGCAGDNNNGNTWQLFNVNFHEMIAYFMGCETGQWSLKQVFCPFKKMFIYFMAF